MNDAVFRIGRVLRQAGGIACWPNFARWVTLMVLAQSPRIVSTVTGLDDWLYSPWAPASLWSVVTTAIWLMGQAAVTDGMFMHLSGRRVGLADLLRTFLRSRASLIQLAVVYGIGTELLSLVPYSMETNGDYVTSILVSYVVGIAVYVYFGVTVPVLTIERTTMFEALKRSVFLTRNHRARMFGLYLLFLFVSVVSRMALVLWTQESADFQTTHIVVGFVFPLITIVFWTAITTALYRALRLAREGIDIQNTLGIPNARVHTPG